MQKIVNAFGIDMGEFFSRSSVSSKECMGNVDDIDTSIDTSIDNEIIDWVTRPESKPYIVFAYNLFKEIPTHLLKRVKFSIDLQGLDFNNNGGFKK
ncbi:hypothetical protein DFR58_101125 [Anaerobacterium chartisolvens]|uniref:Uncharacterized protein n=2 Tax=Anaerobacterium chartisolvens TaxID=1297424 RepID=A0A369BH95_9FIRM|nr:hypothetical protein DFR58_101125 [Anaerobacterium chartisolvens]